VDETGQPGGAVAGENGTDAGPHGDHARQNGGWAAGPWSHAGEALEPAADPVVPTWRRASDNPANRAWAPSRYADLLAPPPARPDRYDPTLMDPATTPVALRAPASAPPFPYEGDLEDAARDRPMIPAERPVPQAERDSFGDPVQPAALADGTPRNGVPVLQSDSWRDAIAARPAPTAPPPVAARPIAPPPVNAAPPPHLNAARPPVTPQFNSVTQAFNSVPPPVSSAPVNVAPPPVSSPPAAPLPEPRPAVTAAPPVVSAPPVPSPLPPLIAPPTAPGPATAFRNGQSVPPLATPRFAIPAVAPAPAPEPMPSPLTSLAPPQEPRAPAYDLPPGYQPPGYDQAQPGYEQRQPGLGTTRPEPDAFRSGYAPAPSYDTSDAYDVPEEDPTGVQPPVPPDPADVLPQRVPAEPDVPVVPEPHVAEPPAETPELARIATHLRRDDVPTEPRDRPEGFDVNAVLAAVRGVAGVRDASLRTTPAGAHSLRLDLADGADPALVSREVARLLQERLGLAAAPQGQAATPPEPIRPTWSDQPPAGLARAETGFGRGESGFARGEAGFARGDSGGLANPWSEPGVAATETYRPVGRRRAQPAARGRATVDPRSFEAPDSVPAYGGSAYPTTQVPVESAPARPLSTGGRPGPRVVIDHVQVSTFGLDATVEVRLAAGAERAVGFASGPAVDAYVLRLCAVAAASAVDDLLATAQRRDDRGRCFVEHAAVVPFGNCEVAVVVVLLVCGGWVEQLAGSALVSGDPRQAVVRAMLAAVNRRLEALL